jgi:hypothetical protein
MYTDVLRCAKVSASLPTGASVPLVPIYAKLIV